MTPSLPHLARLAASLAAAGVLAACTIVQPPGQTPTRTATGPTTPPPAGAVGPGGAASGPRPPGAAPVAPAAAPGPLKPFAEVIKGADKIDGPLVAWKKDDKVWLELKPDDFDRPFFLSTKLKSGIGERMFFGGLMQESGVVEFRRVYNQVQLVWRNVGFIAKPGTPEARAVEAGYSPSLLASAAVLSTPEPERKSVLIEANAIFMADLLGLGMDLQRTYRQGYSFDPRNSALTSVRQTPEAVEIDVLAHYATASIAVPTPGAPPGAPMPSAPRSLPDPRSMFMQIHYSLAPLPAAPMQGRKADARVGYFASGRYDFSDDLERTPRQRYVNRWRLEKKDPSAALSEPVKPIVYWIDRTVPLKYRATITAGILEWNKAFEKIGFKDAIRVEVQPDDAPWDTLDFGRASVRWMMNVEPTFGAIGPSHVDPRSGEILDADIGIESLSSRNVRASRAQIFNGMAADAGAGHDPAHDDADLVMGDLPADPKQRALLASGRLCVFGDYMAEQLDYALGVLEARGDLPPDSPEAEAFAQAYLKDVTMHEVGHTLGLRHNFRSSRAYTMQQVTDPAWVKANGIAGSVMEYAPINLAAPGETFYPANMAFGDTIGPYDYWAIEYAYKPLASGLTQAETDAALEKVAARSAERLLAYGTDEDNLFGIDPEAIVGDLGDDPVAFTKKRIAIAQDLLKRQETRPLAANDDYGKLRRSVSYALRDVARSATVVARQIGGLRTLRDAPGTGRDPLTPVPAADQRRALDVITGSLLAADSFKVSPALQRRLAPDYLERFEALRMGQGSAQTDFSPSVQVMGMQKALLGQLMSDTVATRMIENTERAPDGAGRTLRMPELYARLQQAVWSELGTGGDIPALRREVQRDHVNRLAGLLLRPGAASRADTRGVVRVQARALQERLRAAAARGGLNEETRAHLLDSAETLDQALTAKLQRAGA